jgi:large subunit ribosomal protein L9
MRVILLLDVPNVGKKYDIKNVADGFARNSLIPAKKAMMATKEAIEKLEKEKAIRLQEHNKIIEKLKEVAEKLKNTSLQFELHAGEKNEVFGSVTKKDIELELEKKGFGKLSISIERPIKETGEKLIEINLGEGIKAKAKLVIIPKKK